MTAALALMAKERRRTQDQLSGAQIPATDASVDTESYHDYGTGRFLSRAFMKYGWDLYAPDAKTRQNPYVSPLRASTEQLKGLPRLRSSSQLRTVRCATKVRLTPES